MLVYDQILRETEHAAKQASAEGARMRWPSILTSPGNELNPTHEVER
jgi:hypothetical protein